MHGLRAELRGIKAVAFDLDGVLYQANAPIPGAARTVEAVRGAGLQVRFVTNTTSLSRRLIVEKLERLGFRANAEEVFCPARGAVVWLRPKVPARLSLCQVRHWRTSRASRTTTSDQTPLS